MKKILFIAIAMMMSIPSMAQYYSNGRPIHPRLRNSHSYNQNDTYVGIRGGLTAAHVSSDSKILDGSDSKSGLNLGVVLGTQLTQQYPVYFETGLYYTEKGGKQVYDGKKFTYNLNYLEVPLLLKYKIYTDNRDLSIDPFIGGYLACGVGGKIKNYGDREAYSSFSSEYDDNFKRFDGGIKLGCGLSYQMLYLGMSYDIGLANIGKDNFDETHNGCLNINVGVTF